MKLLWIIRQLIEYSREERRVQREIEELGIYGYVDKYYGPLEKGRASSSLSVPPPE